MTTTGGDGVELAESLPAGATRADFYSGGFCFSGLVATGKGRLIEVLRDQSRQYLDIRQVRIAALDDSQPTGEYSDGLLTKADIEWVAVRAEPPRAEARLYGFVKKSLVRVMLVLRTCRIEGNVHVESGSTDPMVFFLRGLEKGTDRFRRSRRPRWSRCRTAPRLTARWAWRS